METKPKTRKVLDVTDKSTGTTERMTFQAFYNRFGGFSRYKAYAPTVQSILRGEHADWSAKVVEEIVPDKAAVKAALMQTPIALAVAPLKQDAMEQAEKGAREMVARATAELVAGGNDLEVVAPYPDSRVGKSEYRQKYAKYQFFRSITKAREGRSYRRHKDPDIADISAEAVEKFIQRSREDAAFQYEAYVAKLSAKIGEVKDAKLDGNYVWSCSYLNVTKQDDSKECWKTQMIINQSVYGKLFNQFPTRKVK